MKIGTTGGRSVAYLPRTRPELAQASNRSPFRANLWALAHLGVTALITVSSAGGLRDAFPPGSFVVPDQFIDLPGSTNDTFYDRDRVVRVSAVDPFDPTLRSIAVEVLAEQGDRVRDFGTAMAMRSPRFATRAESRMFAALGGDVLSLSVAQETSLALELGMGVVDLSFITGFDAAVFTAAEDSINGDLVQRRLLQATPRIRRAILEILHRVPDGFRPISRVPAEAATELLALQPAPHIADTNA